MLCVNGSALSWCSSITLISGPLSGSTLPVTPSIFMVTGLAWSADLIFLTCFRCFTAWEKNSSSELVELWEAVSTAVFFTCFVHSLFFGCFWSDLRCLSILPALHTTANSPVRFRRLCHHKWEVDLFYPEVLSFVKKQNSPSISSNHSSHAFLVISWSCPL